MIGRLLPKYLFAVVSTCIFLNACLYSQLLSQTPPHLHERYVNILKIMGEDEYDQAIIEFRRLISEHPNFHKAYRKIAEAYISIDDLQGAQSYFEKLLNENPNNPYALYGLARIDFVRKEYDKAIEKLQSSTKIDPRFVDAYGYHGGLPEVYKAKNDLDSGIQYFSELVQADPQNACAYYGLARCHLKKYQWGKALKLLAKAIELEPELTFAYHSMIYSYFRTSRYDNVLETSEELLKVAGRIGDVEMTAYAVMMLGNAYFLQGDYLRALHKYNEALKRARDIGDKGREVQCLNNVAAVYAMSANFPKALQYFKVTLTMAIKAGRKESEVQALTNIANIYKDQGKHREALRYYQEALESAEKNTLMPEVSVALANMAQVYEKRADYDQAVQYQNRALKIAIEIEDKSLQGFILRNLGTLNQDLGNDSVAIDYLFQAREIGIETKDVQVIWESQAGLGLCYEKQGNLQEAITHYMNAIAVYDSVRKGLDIESLRNNFLEDKYEAYPSIVQLLAEDGKFSDAFAYAEKYKAKTILDIVSQRQDVFSELLSDTLQARLQQITSQHESAHKELSLEVSRFAQNKAKLVSLEQKITDLELKRATIMADLRRRHRAYYQLTSPEILELEALQQILSDEQAVIEYILGPEKMSVFVITSDTLIYSQMALNRQRLGRMLAELSPIFGSQGSSEKPNPAQVLNARQADFSIPPAYALYEVLLKPLEVWLGGKKELIIVPDDLQFYLPFEMLVVDTAGVETPRDFENAKFLLEKYDISYVSSASLLNPGLQRPRKSSKGILAMGNPDLGAQPDEPEQGELLASRQPPAARIAGDDLASLPYTETEVKTVGNVLAGSRNRIYTGSRATEEAFKSEASDFSILHLATHFLTNDQQPLYSGIVLTQEQNGQEDGYLQTYEIFNMKLNADLAVLSACNTGLGKLSKGEGLVGISRAFLYAGIPSLVVSLWSVDDKATSIIMGNFYKYVKAGFNKKQALRRAKVDFLKTSHGDPFYWAPFILIGDWKPINLPTQPGLNVWLIGVVMLLVIAATWIVRKRMYSSR